MKMLYKSQIIIPYESFYRRASEGFCRGSIGGGLVEPANVTMT